MATMFPLSPFLGATRESGGTPPEINLTEADQASSTGGNTQPGSYNSASFSSSYNLPAMPTDFPKLKTARKVDNAAEVRPDDWEMDRHFYTKCLNAQIHPLVSSFFQLSQSSNRIVARYCHLHPNTDPEALKRVLSYKPREFAWAGADLFNVTTKSGARQMIVVETNSCPSGQKSMPLLSEWEEHGGYLRVLQGVGLVKPLNNSGGDQKSPATATDEPTLGAQKLVDAVSVQLAEAQLKEAEHEGGPPVQSFAPSAEAQKKPRTWIAERPDEIEGDLAVVWDKNKMEATGYASVLADMTKENVWCVEFYEWDDDPPVKWEDGIMYVRPEPGVWKPIRAAFRYVTAAPWKRIPLRTKTRILNPIVACLAGGRNKAMASVAYDLFNAEMAGTGLRILVPETINNVRKDEVPLRVASWGGFAVIKNPYSNAGQGVWTITNAKELDEFMALPQKYDKLIVQSLIGNASWSSTARTGLQYHIGSMPDKKNQTFVSDIRCMITATPEGFKPVAIYARRARKPLVGHLEEARKKNWSSWEMLGTNLSVKLADGGFTTETERLLLMDRKDFNSLGISIDDLIDGYVQTVLSVIAIDKLARRLVDESTGKFNIKLFKALNDDAALLKEIEAANTNGELM
ncbi:hypothetical protein SAICODRAFT_21924 [Saitoella complicata NRRL Y-17804]|nr:uncharacterized protein SAICODRAFT_21924 [Saitoella complicata NRRL Y-17804]ODQ50182.1 hypothetical protein SAICODRAFT_21924 [Saitoella complicata NRRL Y-17804]